METQDPASRIIQLSSDFVSNLAEYRTAVKRYYELKEQIASWLKPRMSLYLRGFRPTASNPSDAELVLRTLEAIGARADPTKGWIVDTDDEGKPVANALERLYPELDRLESEFKATSEKLDSSGEELKLVIAKLGLDPTPLIQWESSRSNEDLQGVLNLLRALEYKVRADLMSNGNGRGRRPPRRVVTRTPSRQVRRRRKRAEPTERQMEAYRLHIDQRLSGHDLARALGINSRSAAWRLVKEARAHMEGKKRQSVRPKARYDEAEERG